MGGFSSFFLRLVAKLQGGNSWLQNLVVLRLLVLMMKNLFGDVASELPSPSLASTWHLQGNQVDQVQDAKQGQPSSHVNFEHVVGAAWNSLTADTVEPHLEHWFLEVYFWQ